VLGVDIIDAHLALPGERYAGLLRRGPCASRHQSVYELQAADGTYDLTVCRHVLQAILARGPGDRRARARDAAGRLAAPHSRGLPHAALPARRARSRPLLVRDPGALRGGHRHRSLIGRNAYGILAATGLTDIRIDYAIVDTLRVPRATFATILTAWRDGYADAIGQYTGITAEEARAYFDQMIGDVARCAALRGVDGAHRFGTRALARKKSPASREAGLSSCVEPLA
jgi:hypothetical protein